MKEWVAARESPLNWTMAGADKRGSNQLIVSEWIGPWVAALRALASIEPL